MRNAGVIDQNFDGLEFPFDGFEQAFHRAWIAHVAGLSQNSRAARGEWGSRLLERSSIAGAENHIAALRGQSLADRQTNAAAGSGDNSGFAVEFAFRRRSVGF